MPVQTSTAALFCLEIAFGPLVFINKAKAKGFWESMSFSQTVRMVRTVRQTFAFA